MKPWRWLPVRPAGPWRPTARGHLILAAYWFPLSMQTTALTTLVLPRALLGLAGGAHLVVLGRLAAAGAALAMVVPPVAGAVSDRLRQGLHGAGRGAGGDSGNGPRAEGEGYGAGGGQTGRDGGRRAAPRTGGGRAAPRTGGGRGAPRWPLILGGAAVNVAGLAAMGVARSTAALSAGFAAAVVGSAVSVAAYQALLPDLVPASQRGTASGYRALASMTGTVAGLVAGALTGGLATYGVLGGALAVGAVGTAAGVPEGGPAAPDGAVDGQDGQDGQLGQDGQDAQHGPDGQGRQHGPDGQDGQHGPDGQGRQHGPDGQDAQHGQRDGRSLPGGATGPEGAAGPQGATGWKATAGTEATEAGTAAARRAPPDGPGGARRALAALKSPGHRDFALVFTGRFFAAAGLTLLTTFGLYFFRDAMHAPHPQTLVATVGVVGSLVAAATSVAAGRLSDRFPRSYATAAAGVPLAVSAAAYGFLQTPEWAVALSVLFGVGYGAYSAVDWALAVDVLPRAEDAARDLGTWGIASYLPGVLAPVAGTWILQAAGSGPGGPTAGYRVLFVVAGLCFAAGSAAVLFVRGGGGPGRGPRDGSPEGLGPRDSSPEGREPASGGPAGGNGQGVPEGGSPDRPQEDGPQGDGPRGHPGARRRDAAGGAWQAAGGTGSGGTGGRSPVWAVAVRLALLPGVLAWLGLRCRVRVWGRLPRTRGATLVVANHVHDMEAVALPAALYLRGPWRHPVYALASQRLFEPGAVTARTPALLRPVVGPRVMRWLLGAAGALPVENEPRRRALSSLAWEVARRHGDMPLERAFDAAAASVRAAVGGLGPGGLRLRDAWSHRLAAATGPVPLTALRQPYRSEVAGATRQRVTAQLARARDVLDHGGTLVLFPEGHISRDGRLGRLRGGLGPLLAGAEGPLRQGGDAGPGGGGPGRTVAGGGSGAVRVVVAGVSLDPLSPGHRLPVLVRLVPPGAWEAGAGWGTAAAPEGGSGGRREAGVGAGSAEVGGGGDTPEAAGAGDAPRAAGAGDAPGAAGAGDAPGRPSGRRKTSPPTAARLPEAWVGDAPPPATTGGIAKADLRSGPLADRLRAARPVTAGQALCAWLAPRTGGPPFTVDEAVAGVRDAVASLPPGAFLEPGLRADPGRCVRACVDGLRRGGRIESRGGLLQVAAVPWRDRRVPLVGDLLAHEANTFTETHRALGRAFPQATPCGRGAP